ncbi:MAG: transposase, partial [Waterburya sp.]
MEILFAAIAIFGSGRIKPALIITNDFDLSIEHIVRKYARRWIVEKTISEQIEFFHLNRLSSAMVIKVDFDLTMSILAYNLYKVFAGNLEGYQHCTAETLYRKFIQNSGTITVEQDSITVELKKKRHLPLILTALEP